MPKSEALALETFAQTSYRKCDCCKRVRDIYFRLNVKNAEATDLLVGSLELCRDCGQNFGAIIGKPAKTEQVTTEFKFKV